MIERIQRYRFYKELKNYPKENKMDRIDALFLRKKMDWKGIFWTILLFFFFWILMA